MILPQNFSDSQIHPRGHIWKTKLKRRVGQQVNIVHLSVVQTVMIKCIYNCFNSNNEIKSDRLGVTQTCMQFHLLLIWLLTASFFTSTQSIPERSRPAGSKAPEGQNGSQENYKNEIGTENVVAGTHAKVNAHK